MKLGSLFAGIGGFELAATWAGIEPVWSNEIDSWCCKVLRKNFNHEIIEEDIRLLYSDTGRKRRGKRADKIIRPQGEKSRIQDANNICNERKLLSKVDIICGGFPCQPFSHAGKRKGKDDDRYLWPEMLRIISEVGPSWVIGENVAGLKSMDSGKTLDRILTDLENIGYQTETFLIPACSVGAWHRRDRIWIVGHSKQNGFTERAENIGEFKGASSLPECSEDVSNTSSNRSTTGIPEKGQRQKRESGIFDHSCSERDGQKFWSIEPSVGRVAHGIPNRVDRLKGLGNAIVPQVAYEIFKAIVSISPKTL